MRGRVTEPRSESRKFNTIFKLWLDIRCNCTTVMCSWETKTRKTCSWTPGRCVQSDSLPLSVTRWSSRWAHTHGSLSNNKAVLWCAAKRCLLRVCVCMCVCPSVLRGVQPYFIAPICTLYQPSARFFRAAHSRAHLQGSSADPFRSVFRCKRRELEPRSYSILQTQTELTRCHPPICSLAARKVLSPTFPATSFTIRLLGCFCVDRGESECWIRSRF